jgi:hypothetical protein
MKTLGKRTSRLLLASVLILSLAATLIVEGNVALAQPEAQSKVEVHQVTDSLSIMIRKFMVASEIGLTATFVDQTAAPTRLQIVYTEPMGQRTVGIIPASSVFGYSVNHGTQGPITVSGAWMMRWVVTGSINLSDCSTSLKIWEYFIPGLEVACVPLVGCNIGATMRESKGYYHIQFGSHKGYGYEALTLPPVVPGTNSRIEARIELERVPVVAPDKWATVISQADLGPLFSPPCQALDYGVLKPKLPMLLVVPPHTEQQY